MTGQDPAGRSRGPADCGTSETKIHGDEMRKLTRVTITLLLLSNAGFGAKDEAREPYTFFREYIGLSDDQIEAIHRGKAIAKVLDSPTADKVFVFGAVFVEATPESYLAVAGDVARLRKLPGF